MATPLLRPERRPYSVRRTSSNRSSTKQRPPPNSDFVEFVHRTLDFCFLPITYPLRLIRDVVTSPLTISVVLKGVLAFFLIASSAVFSILAVGAFWWSWGTGGSVEVEGWLIYGSRLHRTPHALMALPTDRFQEDLPYDVQVELELVRPTHGGDEAGNFMVTLELRSLREPNVTLVRVSQPSLPPPPLPSSIISIGGFPYFPSWMVPPCVLPWPFRFLCPSRIFGYAGVPDARIKERRRRGTLVSPARGKEVVLLTKELLEQVTITPARGHTAIGAAFVSIGREDSGEDGFKSSNKEVRTTGWVVVRFIPHPTGIRWLLTSNPLPPLIILPPLSLSLTIASALIGFFVISFCFGRGKSATKQKKSITDKVSKDKFDKYETDADVAARRAELENVWANRARQEQEDAWDHISSRSRSRSRSPRPQDESIVQADSGERRQGQVLRIVKHPSPSDTSDGGTEFSPSNTVTGETISPPGTVTGSEGTEAWTESESWQSS